MVGRRSELPIEKKKINLVVGDFEAMGTLFPSLGPSVAIRVLVHSYVKRVRSSLQPLDIEAIPDGDLPSMIAEEL